MYCINCGNPIHDGDTFCTTCGTPVPTVVDSEDDTVPHEDLKCPNCGHIIVSGNSFCTECGTPIHGRFAGAIATNTSKLMSQSIQYPDATVMLPAAEPITQPQRQNHNYAQASNDIRTKHQDSHHSTGSKFSIVMGVLLLLMAGITVFSAYLLLKGSLPLGELISLVSPDTPQTSQTTASSPNNEDPAPQGSESQEVLDSENEISSAQDASDEAITPTESIALDSRTTPVGNLINGGYAASGSGWVFYAVPTTQDGWYTSSIGRMREDGTEQSVIYHASGKNPLIWHLNVLDGRLYFNEDINDTDSSIVSIDIDGTDRQKIAICRPGTLCQVFKGVVYYMSLDGLTGYDPETGDRWLFQGGTRNDELWRVWNTEETGSRKDGDCAFFFEQGKDSLTSNRWSGSSVDEKTILKLTGNKSIVNVVPDDSGLWILVDNNDDGKGDEILLSSFDGSQVETFASCSGPTVRMNPTKKGIVVVVKDTNETRVEMITKKGGKPVVYYSGSADESVLYPSIQGELLVFGLLDIHHLVKVPLNSPSSKPVTIA